MKMESIALIAALSNANGISGFEDEVVAIAKAYAGEIGGVEEDHLRNLFIYRKGNTGSKPVVMLDAHSDEIGFIIQAIHRNGTIKFLPVGGWHPQVIMGHKVRVRTSDGQYVPGVVASKPPHFIPTAEKDKLIEIRDMLIDVGATSKDEVIQKFKINIGAPVIPDVRFFYHEGNQIMRGKAFDCRLGCAAVIETLKRLQNQDLGVDIVGTISAQEEVGLRGVKVASRKVQPDAAIIFEGTPADDTFLADELIQAGIKRGPQIRHWDPSMIANPRFVNFAMNVAARMGLSYQIAVRESGGTNAAVINLAGRGIPAIVLSIPVRYAHSHYGYAALEDYDGAVAWGCEVINSLNRAVIDLF
jgi:putative aminopeptidase FrvX